MLTFEEKFRAFRKKSKLPLNTTNDMSKKVKVKKKVESCRNNLCPFRNNKIKNRKSAGLTVSFIKNTC